MYNNVVIVYIITIYYKVNGKKIMQNIFIVNPAAGKRNSKDNFISQITAFCDTHEDCSTYITKGISDATEFVKKTCQNSNEHFRFFACGGDGTLNEVINGAAGHNNAIVGCLPIGTGNDFVRNFKTDGDFLNFEHQINGNVFEIDLIEYQGSYNGQIKSGFSANMFNIGFDCNVVDMTAKLKKHRLISGSFAYLLGVALILIQKKGANLKISSKDDVLLQGPLLLTTIANGCYCGGGVKSNPTAEVDDGLFDLQIILDMSRLTFINLFPKYSKGTHLSSKKAKDLILYKVLNYVNIEAINHPMRASIDGEVTSFDSLTLSIGNHKMLFSVPQPV